MYCGRIAAKFGSVSERVLSIRECNRGWNRSRATGSVITGVSIVATNTGNGVVTTVLTNEVGAYQFASLQPGIYDIRADLAGFQPAVAKRFQLGGAQQARLNFTLRVGTTATAADVNVAADALLATSSNSIGTVLPEYKVRDLPLAVRDVFGLVAAAAGVGPKDGQGMVNNLAGGRQSAVNTTRDGINVSSGRFEDGAWSITYTSPDLVEEVKIVVAPVDAQTSRGSGQVSLVTRSGTNQVRGSVFWANHNSALDANSWFNNFNSVAKNYDNRNQYGARVGGPIVRNKTFFFLLFEGQRDLKRENFAGTTLTDMAARASCDTSPASTMPMPVAPTLQWIATEIRLRQWAQPGPLRPSICSATAASGALPSPTAARFAILCVRASTPAPT